MHTKAFAPSGGGYLVRLHNPSQGAPQSSLMCAARSRLSGCAQGNGGEETTVRAEAQVPELLKEQHGSWNLPSAHHSELWHAAAREHLHAPMNRLVEQRHLSAARTRKGTLLKSGDHERHLVHRDETPLGASI